MPNETLKTSQAGVREVAMARLRRDTIVHESSLAGEPVNLALTDGIFVWVENGFQEDKPFVPFAKPVARMEGFSLGNNMDLPVKGSARDPYDIAGSVEEFVRKRDDSFSLAHGHEINVFPHTRDIRLGHSPAATAKLPRPKDHQCHLEFPISRSLIAERVKSTGFLDIVFDPVTYRDIGIFMAGGIAVIAEVCEESKMRVKDAELLYQAQEEPPILYVPDFVDRPQRDMDMVLSRLPAFLREYYKEAFGVPARVHKPVFGRDQLRAKPNAIMETINGTLLSIRSVSGAS